MFVNFFYYWSKFLKKFRGRSIIRSVIHPSAKIEAGSLVVNSQVGKHSFCGYDCELINCSIGRFCSIANCVFIGGAEHPISWISTSPAFYRGRDSIKKKFCTYERPPAKRTVIGHDVWIGYGAMVKAGVTIGNGAIIGMGAVVTKNVPSYAIVGGNPAKIIRYRFERDLIEQLEKSAWWEMDEKLISSCAKFAKEPSLFLAHLCLKKG